jgi:DNA polymerase I-like protein with 3'-5' exonuclease and polymerase domains
MGAGTLLHNNPESFASRAEAQKVIDTLNRLFPRTARFRNAIREKAHRQTYLLSRHGYIRRFFDVLHWDAATGRMVPGDDSESAVAFQAANAAHATLKEAMLRLEQQGWNERAQLINQIHDALMFHIPEALMDEAIPAIKAEMERKSDILVDPVVAPDGLWIETSVSVGRDWGAMEELDPKAGWAKKAA